MREQLVRLARALFNREPSRSLLEGMVRLGMKANPAIRTILQNPTLYGAVFPLLVDDSLCAHQLDEVPSETSQAERRFLYHFFAKIWQGQKNVCEMGPFLGGTTRAIAMGMRSNPKRHDGCKLYTFDRFRDYYDSEALISYLQPLFTAGLLGDDARKEVQDSGSFKGVFAELHRGKSYSSMIVAVDEALPNTADDVLSLENPFQLEPTVEFDAVFVDGCKSWYATKYFMLQVSKCADPGTFFLFQDYGRYTCFWIPAFLGAMRDEFRLVSYVDSTYTFQLTRSLDLDLINSLYPDSPETLQKSFFDGLFAELLAEAENRNDGYALVINSLQHAAALAYLGYRSEAKAKIGELATQQYARKYRSTIEAAQESPTYFPDGQAIFL